MVTNKNPSNATTPERFVPTSEILARTSFCKSTILRLEKAGLFPKRQIIGKRKKGLPESVFIAWLASRAPADTAQ
ncbi:MAG: AlpA family phage regulatory protein [Thiothrix sp.]|nr:MAG: AlpA family phage regulatory protein [Thiothrix sp.]